MKKMCIYLSLILAFTGFAEEFSFRDKTREEIIKFSKETWSYLKKNSSKINMNGKYTPLTVLDADITPGAVFVHGELHDWREQNQNISLQMIHHLLSKTERVYILFEGDPAGVFMINSYLESGDKSILEDMYKVSDESGKLKIIMPECYLNEIRLISKYMKKEIRFIGIDHCVDVLSAIRASLNVLDRAGLTEKSIQQTKTLKLIYAKMKKYYDSISVEDGRRIFISMIKSKEHDEFLDILTIISEDMKTEEAVYRKVLGDFTFNYFNVMIGNIQLSAERRRTIYPDMLEQFYKTRDDIMYRTFLAFHRVLPSGVYYGSFGNRHIFQEEYQLREECDSTAGFKSFLYLLSKDPGSPVKGKVFGIFNLYNGSNDFEQLLTAVFFNSVQEKGWLLYRLTGDDKDNPFTRYSFLQEDTNPKERKTTDFINYIIYLQKDK